jgi:tRNA/rRNA methyltransferase
MANATVRAPVIILVRPQLGENIGMAARAMANFGLDQLRLVAPRDGWDVDGIVYQAAIDSAVGSNAIVRAARLYDTLEAASADLSCLFATTARLRDQSKPILSPSAMAAEIATRESAGQGCGVFFGPERTGLTNDEIALASLLVTYPVDPQQPSLNLAQSVSLAAYEIRKARLGEMPARTLEHVTPPASREMVFSFFEWLDEELAQANYFIPAGKRPVMSRNLRNIFHRMELTEADIRTLRGMMQALARGRRNRPGKGLSV